MNNWDSRYAERVKLLVEILPTLAAEKRFALKGGTAINLFEHDEPRDFEQTFTAHFQGMTAAPVTAASLLDVRARLLKRISELLDETSCAFLESVEREAPDFNLIELPHAASLPGVRRKLANLSQRSAGKRAADYDRLTAVLAHRPSS